MVHVTGGRVHVVKLAYPLRLSLPTQRRLAGDLKTLSAHERATVAKEYPDAFQILAKA